MRLIKSYDILVRNLSRLPEGPGMSISADDNANNSVTQIKTINSFIIPKPISIQLISYQIMNFYGKTVRIYQSNVVFHLAKTMQ